MARSASSCACSSGSSIAVLIAVVIAEVRTLISGGDRLHTFQISLVIVGCLLPDDGRRPGNDSAPTTDRH